MLISSINKTQIHPNNSNMSLMSERGIILHKNDVLIEGKIRYHHGVFDISCTSLKSPFVLREDLLKIFTNLKINSIGNEVKSLI